MLQKILLTGLFISLFGQILFSLFYSQEIVRQNSLLQQQLATQNSLILQQQSLENQLAEFGSINSINQTLQKYSYQPLIQTINLNDPLQP